MKKAVVIAIAASLGFAGCDENIMEKANGETMYAPDEGHVEAIIKMPDGKIERFQVKKWRQRHSAIAIDTGTKEFYTGFENVVMIFDKPNKEESK